MKSVETRLLIYIPTYNRVDLALAQLDGLLGQIATKDDVRVVISDNASAVGDPKRLEEFCAKNERFEYRSNLSNLGGEANFLFGFCLARPTEHLWILADDTPIQNGAVEYLLNHIDLGRDMIAMAPRQQTLRPKTYNFMAQVLGYTMKHFQWGLISSVVYNMELVSSHVINGFKLHNTAYVHLAILYSSLASVDEVSIEWLDTERLHGENWLDPGSDYSLALAGSPLLYSLAPKWERKSLARDYMWRNSGAFAQAAERHPFVAQQSFDLLVRYGGPPARFAYLIGVLEYRLRRSRLGRKLDSFLESHPRFLGIVLKSGRLPFRIK